MTANSPKHADPNRCFMPDYVTARANFQKAAAEAGGRLESLKLSADGPRQEPLTIDIAWFGAENPRRVFIHSCGVHGVEAFAGSAIQLQWLREGVRLPTQGDAIVLVHVLNPYGMAWLRRFNENNVDLNRNFREPGEYRAQMIKYWETVNALLNPPSAPTADGFYLRAAWLVLRYGMSTMREAVAGGQCLNPKGLFYAGAKLEEGPAEFRKFMRQRVMQAQRIVAIDVHTGLGRFGEDRLLVDSRVAGTGVFQTMRDFFGGRIELLNKQGIAYTTKGTHDDMYYRSFPRAKIYFITQEFGTYKPLRVVAALRDENRAHHYGGDRQAAKKALMEIFTPASEEWRGAILRRGQEVISSGLAVAFETPAI